MNSTVASDDLLDRTFQLAYFIHGDKQIATQITADALMKLEVAAAAQDKRLYYTPSGRSPSKVSRNKVFMSELHLLQRLVYIESEPHECRKEQVTGLLGEADMLIHFVKHLVKITVKRNSFYVTLALSRLLHSYTTAETQDMYGVLVQDPDRVRDDYYYRSRKSRLMREVEERFRGLIRTIKVNRGEERFESVGCPGACAALVRKCLAYFTPWNTPCVVGAGMNPLQDAISDLMFDSRDPDGEHRVEVNRIHTALHPDCYARLTRALGFDAPESRLLVPHFFLASQAGGDDGSRGDRNHPPGLSDEDRARIRSVLAEQSARRKAAVGGLLRVMVDGRERARLDLARSTRARFEIEEGAELIEVRQMEQNGDLLLAAHLLEYDASGDNYKSSQSAIVLEGGQKLSFLIANAKESDGAMVDVTYRETSPLRAAALWLRQLGVQASEALSVRQGTAGAVWKPALALALLTLFAAGFFVYFQSVKSSPPQMVDEQPPVEPQPQKEGIPAPQPPDTPPAPPQVVENHTPPKPDKPKHSDGDKDSQKEGRRPETPLEGTHIASNPQPQEDPQGESSIGDQPRGTKPVGATLLEVKNVCIEALGKDALNRQIRDLIAAGLQSGSRFNVVPGRDAADALLKVSVKKGDPKRAGDNFTVIAHMLNAEGYVIWPAAPKGSGEKYTGAAKDVAAKLVQDILAAMQNQERRR